jgi:hypothetical protein
MIEKEEDSWLIVRKFNEETSKVPHLERIFVSLYISSRCVGIAPIKQLICSSHTTQII